MGGGAFHAAVHGFVGEAVGVLVFVAEGVGDLEAVEAADAGFGFLPEGFEVGGVDFVLALDLLDHELGVGDDAEGAVAVVEGELEAGEEAGVFGVVIGAEAEELGEFGEDVALCVGDLGAEAGGTGVTAGAAVAVGGDGVGGVGGEWKKTGGHGMSLIGFDGVAATMKSDISPQRLRLHSGVRQSGECLHLGRTRRCEGVPDRDAYLFSGFRSM